MRTDRIEKREKVEYFKTWKEAEKVYQKLYRRQIQYGYKVVKSKKLIKISFF